MHNPHSHAHNRAALALDQDEARERAIAIRAQIDALPAEDRSVIDAAAEHLIGELKRRNEHIQIGKGGAYEILYCLRNYVDDHGGYHARLE